MTATTIAAVVLGEYEDGQTVTLTGRAANINGTPSATFLLIDRTGEDAVRVFVSADVLRSYGHDLVGDPADDGLPPLITVTGWVDRRKTVSALVAEKIRREES
jgi:hypothetical protein